MRRALDSDSSSDEDADVRPPADLPAPARSTSGSKVHIASPMPEDDANPPSLNREGSIKVSVPGTGAPGRPSLSRQSSGKINNGGDGAAPDRSPAAVKEEWSLASWIASLPEVNGTIADALRPPDGYGDSELDYLRKLGQGQTGPEAMETILAKGNVLSRLSMVLATAASRFAQQRAATAVELHEKFCQDDSSTRMSYGGLDSFFRGLDGVIGQPATDLQAGIHREHAKSRDSQHVFEATNCAWSLVSTLRSLGSSHPCCSCPPYPPCLACWLTQTSADRSSRV